jgi:hypothetical protein
VRPILRTYLEKPFTKIGLVEWLEVKALSSSPSTAKKKEKKKGTQGGQASCLLPGG